MISSAVVLALTAVALGIALFLMRRRFVVVHVVGVSMEPVLRAGQRVLVRRSGIRAVKRGDLVVFALASVRSERPGDPPWMVKRAIALPGDLVPRESMPPSLDAEQFFVPEERLVVRGDNAARSFDSRHAGYIDGSSLLGVVLRKLA